jgi:protein O-GlcNAc transferase
MSKKSPKKSPPKFNPLAQLGLAHAKSNEIVISASKTKKMLKEACDHFLARRFAQAQPLFESVLIDEPDNPFALNYLGLIHFEQGKTVQGIQLMRRSLELDAQDASFWNNYGHCCLKINEIKIAHSAFLQSIHLNPTQIQARMNAAICLAKMDEQEQAYDIFLTLREENPLFEGIHVYLIMIATGWDVYDIAEQHISRLPDEFRNNPPIIQVIAALRVKQGRFDEALALMYELVSRNPNDAYTFNQMGQILIGQGHLEEAKLCFGTAYQLNPRNLAIKLNQILLIGQQNLSIDDIYQKRNHLLYDIEQFPTDYQDALNDFGMLDVFNLFPLAYHGLNNREIYTKTHDLIRKIFPQVNYTAPHLQQWQHPAQTQPPRKIKIGFFSRFFFTHPVGRHFHSLINELDRTQFEVYLLDVAWKIHDPIAQALHESCHAIKIPMVLERARTIIAEQALDLLIFTDIGMDWFSYLLAFARLAHRQAVFLGHPDTTGINTIDYMISYEGVETAQSIQKYSEHVILIPNHISQVLLPQSTLNKEYTKSYFGLPEDQYVFLCQQTFFKYHPDFDTALKVILSANPNARLALIRHEGKSHWFHLFEQRLKHTLGEQMAQIIFLPTQSYEDYKGLSSVCDLILDTFHFGGSTSSLDAFSFGTPVLTLAGEFCQSRNTKYYYDIMGLTDLIVSTYEAYSELAVALSYDIQKTRSYRDFILNNCYKLFKDRDAAIVSQANILINLLSE